MCLGWAFGVASHLSTARQSLCGMRLWQREQKRLNICCVLLCCGNRQRCTHSKSHHKNVLLLIISICICQILTYFVSSICEKHILPLTYSVAFLIFIYFFHIRSSINLCVFWRKHYERRTYSFDVLVLYCSCSRCVVKKTRYNFLFIFDK